MDWTFWVGGAVIVVLVIVTQVFLHESRWSQRERPEEPDPDDDRWRPEAGRGRARDDEQPDAGSSADEPGPPTD